MVLHPTVFPQKLSLKPWRRRDQFLGFGPNLLRTTEVEFQLPNYSNEITCRQFQLIGGIDIRIHQMPRFAVSRFGRALICTSDWSSKVKQCPFCIPRFHIFHKQDQIKHVIAYWLCLIITTTATTTTGMMIVIIIIIIIIIIITYHVSSCFVSLFAFASDVARWRWAEPVWPGRPSRLSSSGKQEATVGDSWIYFLVSLIVSLITSRFRCIP